MLEDTSVAGTDAWWLMQLAAEFGDGLPRIAKLDSYVDGTALLPVEGTSASQRDAYLRFVKRSRLNLADPTVAARTNRLRALGFRTAAPGDLTGDAQAQRNWTRSSMNVGSRDLFSDFATFGSGYLFMTGPTTPSADAEPLMVRSSPWSTFSRQYATQPHLTEGAISVGFDDVAGVEIMTLLRPGYIRTAVRSAKKSSVSDSGKRWVPGRGWEWATEQVSLGYTDQVPVARISMKDGKGVFEAHTDSLDRINSGILERTTIWAMQAFRQRALTGDLPKVYPEDHPLAGQTIDYDAIFAAGPAALWMLPVGAEIWESAVTDTTQLLAGNKQDVIFYSAATSTPLYTLLPDANVAAGAADLAREGIIFAVEEMQDRAAPGLQIAQSLNFQALGDPVRARAGEIEVIWAKAARISITEQSAAAASARVGGMPQRMIDEKIWQMTPAEIQQARQDRTDEQFEQPIAAPTSAPATAPAAV